MLIGVFGILDSMLKPGGSSDPSDPPFWLVATVVAICALSLLGVGIVIERTRPLK